MKVWYTYLMIFYHKNKRIFGAFLFVILLLINQKVLAAPDFVGAGARDLGVTINTIFSYMGVINTFCHVLLLIALEFVQYLLQSDFFSNIQMMQALNDIWKLSRDIMNVFFAIMLIGVALYTIVTANKSFVTEKIANFVIAVILVNMSWFFPRVIIDIANILTSTVYSIPQYLGNAKCEIIDGMDPTKKIPCKSITGYRIFPSLAEEKDFKNNCGSGTCECQRNIACYKLQSLDDLRKTGVSESHVMINGLVVNFARVLDLTKIPAAIRGGGGGGIVRGFFSQLQLLMGVAFATVIQLATLLPLVALAVGLLIRILILWLTAAFMPFVFLGYVINGKLGTNVFGFEVDIWQEFISAAFIPTMVAIPITIGYVILNAVTSVTAPKSSAIAIPLLYGVQSWWAMLWMIAGIAVLWKGSFAALSKNKTIGGMTDKIKGFGEQVGGSVAKLPLLTPLPIGGGGMNLASLVHAPRAISDIINVSASGRPGTGDVRKNIREAFGGREAADDPATVDAMATKLSTSGKADAEKIVAAINKLKTAEFAKDTNPTQRAEQVEIIRQKVGAGVGASEKEIFTRLKAISERDKVAEFRGVVKDDINKLAK